MKTLIVLFVIFAAVVSAIMVMCGDVAEASYLIQVQILVVLLQIKYNKEE